MTLKPLIIRFKKEMRRTIDMEGFPIEEMRINRDKIEVIDNYTEEFVKTEVKFLIRYVPTKHNFFAYVSPDISKDQANEAIIEYILRKVL
jgi:hypothetical protein